MSKALCMIALIISALLFIVFVLDAAIGIPFQRANMGMDIGFIVCSAGLGALSFLVFRKAK